MNTLIYTLVFFISFIILAVIISTIISEIWDTWKINKEDEEEPVNWPMSRGNTDSKNQRREKDF